MESVGLGGNDGFGGRRMIVTNCCIVGHVDSDFTTRRRATCNDPDVILAIFAIYILTPIGELAFLCLTH